MFSGIIEKRGTLIQKKQDGPRVVFTFQATPWDKPLKRGESISVNGVCLTMTKAITRSKFRMTAVPETLATTTLGSLKIKDPVNLERSLKWGERIGGHFVLGHVDGVGRVTKRTGRGKSFSLQIHVPAPVIQHLVPKGSIAIDGISFTIQKLLEDSIVIAVIPHTAKVTNLGRKKAGDRVNLEADVIAKHLARWVQPGSPEIIRE